MEVLSSEVLSDIESKVEEYNRLCELCQSVEVCQDIKLLRFYESKRKFLEKLTELYKNLKDVQSEIELGNNLLSTSLDINEKVSFSENVSKLLNRSKEIEQALMEEYENLKAKKFETARLEITNSRDESSKEILTNMLKSFAEKRNFNFTSSNEDNVFLVEGENAYTTFYKLYGLYQIIDRGKTESVSLLVFQTQSYQNDINIDDIKIEYSKSSGAGGQHINKTESAVRLVHLPTGISAECQDERSQIQNKEKALQNLKEKISQYYAENAKKHYDFERISQKNAIFSKTPNFIIDFDKNKFIVQSSKQELNLSEALSGNLIFILNNIK